MLFLICFSCTLQMHEWKKQPPINNHACQNVGQHVPFKSLMVTNPHLNAAAVIRRQQRNLVTPKLLKKRFTQNSLQTHLRLFFLWNTPKNRQAALLKINWVNNPANSPVQYAALLVRCLKKAKQPLHCICDLLSQQRFSVGLPSWDRHWASPWQPGSWNVSNAQTRALL